MSTPQRNTPQTVAHIVVTATAILASYRNDRWVAFALMATVLIVVVPVYVGPTREWIRSKKRSRTRDRYARQAWGELADFHSRFPDLLNRDRSDSAPGMVRAITKCRSDLVEWLYPANHELELFTVRHGYFKTITVKNGESFEQSAVVLNEFIIAHVLAFDRMGEKLRTSKHTDSLEENYPNTYNISREKWGVFIDEWMAFLRKAKLNGFDIHRHFWKPGLL